jgi:hypothetical protein
MNCSVARDYSKTEHVKKCSIKRRRKWNEHIFRMEGNRLVRKVRGGYQMEGETWEDQK